MERILTIVDWYLPGFKAGGPIRTVSNMVELLCHEFDFHVLTRDRDLHDQRPYPNVPRDTWTETGRARVYYASELSLCRVRRVINDAKPDIIYLNSFFSRLTIKVLFLRRLGLILRCPIVLAPRGEFSPGALSIKFKRKKAFLKGALPFLYSRVLWHGSTQGEGMQIWRILATYAGAEKRKARVKLARNIHVASDIPVITPNIFEAGELNAKRPGEVRFIFLSRISRMKNLKHALQACRQLKGNVTLDIYGPLEQRDYFEECRSIIETAPENIKIEYKGAVPPDKVQSTMAHYHFMILPTLGENFGHVILEALGAGCPVVISDQTPWTHLENAGWALPLDDMEVWRIALQIFVNMDNKQYQAMSANARDFARRSAESPAIREENIKLFKHALLDSQPESKTIPSE
jgi:glycosyltransferase involved in cell wall biosynthesis